MASQALYLRWRPQRFEDVVGQEHVTTTLKNALRGGRISHAYLFSGPRGTGKTTMARLLAKAVNCLDEDVNRRPCNECHICRSINEGRLLDLIEMDAASHTGVDNVREAIRDKVGFRPTEARYKVYVIDEVHMLSTSAFNALLKTLEEPPEHVIFCLATTEPHKVLPTILSRCQRFEFRRIPLPALVSRLQFIADQEGLQVEEAALQFIARMSTGCARDAISMLDQLTAYGDDVVTVERVRSVLGLSDEQVIYELIGHLAAHSVGQGLDVINQVVEGGADMRQFTQQIVETLRSILLLRVGGDAAVPDLTSQTRATLGTLVEHFSTRDLVRVIKLFNQAQLTLRGSDHNRLALELAFVEAAMVEDTSLREETRDLAVIAPPVSAQPAVQPAKASRQAPTARAPDTSVRPAAPRRSAQEPQGTTEQESSMPDYPLVAVALEELDGCWDSEIKKRFRSEGQANVFSLLNSAVSRRIEDENQIVFEFSTKVVASKLTLEKQRIAEDIIDSVLGKQCRVRGTLRDMSVPASASESTSQGRSHPTGSEVTATPLVEQADPERAAPPVADPYQEATSDPVIQDLVSRGGKVTDVQVLSEE